MKKTYYIFIILIVLLGFVSCSDDGFGHEEEVEEGLPTTIKINFSAPEAENITTKSASVSDFTKINSLYIFLFDKDGKLDGFANPDVSTASSITISTTTGAHTIYGVANYYGTELGDVSSKLAAVTSLSELKAITAELISTKLEIVNNTMMMAGFYATSENGAKNGEVATANFTTNDTNTYTVYLNRLFTGINFNVSCGRSDATFTLNSYRVVNIPKTTTLLDANSAPSLYSAATSQDFETTDAKVSSFSFYMLENAAGYKSAASTLAARESRKNQGTSQIQGDWVNAPSSATYIILKGVYRGPESSTSSTIVNADATYYLHLGDFSSNPGDYNSYRNKNYTYNISVEGVSDIEAEVTASGAEYGPADATITFGGKMLEVDAHYSSLDITLNGGETYTYSWDETTYGSTPWVFLAPGSGLTYSDIKESDLIKSESDLYKYLKGKTGQVTFTAFVNENYPTTGAYDEWTNYVNTDNRIFKIIPSGGSTNYKNGSVVLNDGILISQKPIMTFFNNSGYAYGIEWTNESHAVLYGNKDNNAWKADGMTNMKMEMGSKATWSDVYTINKAYIACMQRNRDENHNGKISDDEIKWYLPSVAQISGLWVGKSLLGNAWFFSGSTSDLKQVGGEDYAKINGVWKGVADIDTTYHFWTSSSRKIPGTSTINKRFLLSEEGGSFDTNTNMNTDKYQIRCIRNLGQTKTSDNDYYTYDSKTNTFDFTPLTKLKSSDTNSALRESVSSELIKHSETSPSNKFAQKFRLSVRKVYSVASGTANGKAPTTYNTPTFNWRTVNNSIDKDPTSSPCYNYAEDNITWSRTGTTYTIKSADDLHKWRLPNQQELSLIITASLIKTTEGKLISRTYFSNQNYRLGYAYSESILLLPTNGEENGFYVRCVRDVE